MTNKYEFLERIPSSRKCIVLLDKLEEHLANNFNADNYTDFDNFIDAVEEFLNEKIERPATIISRDVPGEVCLENCIENLAEYLELVNTFIIAQM